MLKILREEPFQGNFVQYVTRKLDLFKYFSINRYEIYLIIYLFWEGGEKVEAASSFQSA